MKNNTFDQIINSDLTSIDPGFGQFALAKASADLMKKVQEACMGQALMGKAPMAVIVCSDSTRVMGCDQRASTVDCSIAMSFMMLAATAEGLGTCWIGGFTQEPLKEALGIPAEYDVVALTPLGYPAEEGRPRDRKPLEELVYKNGWKR